MNHIFKSDTKRFLANELKSWMRTAGFIALFYLAGTWFPSHAIAIFQPVTFSVWLSIQLADMLMQYHVRQLKIDTEKRLVTFRLYSNLLGYELKSYDLLDVRSILTENTGLKRLFLSPVYIKIAVSKNKFFRINTRYGFTRDTLVELNEALAAANKLITTGQTINTH